MHRISKKGSKTVSTNSISSSLSIPEANCIAISNCLCFSTTHGVASISCLFRDVNDTINFRDIFCGQCNLASRMAHIISFYMGFIVSVFEAEVNSFRFR